jgi:hypothetical protein
MILPENRGLTHVRREATVTHASKKPLPDREIAAGRKLVIRVHMSPTMDDSRVNTRTLTETVLHIEPQSQLAWGAPSRGWLFGAQSWHVLSDVEGGTKFEIVAVFGGVAGSLMMKFMGKAFKESIQAMANGLKTRCEQS